MAAPEKAARRKWRRLKSKGEVEFMAK